MTRINQIVLPKILSSNLVRTYLIDSYKKNYYYGEMMGKIKLY
jgi:hypothetical protein